MKSEKKKNISISKQKVQYSNYTIPRSVPTKTYIHEIPIPLSYNNYLVLTPQPNRQQQQQQSNTNHSPTNPAPRRRLPDHARASCRGLIRHRRRLYLRSSRLASRLTLQGDPAQR